MNWENKALRDIVKMLMEEDKKHSELFNKLYDLNITVDINGSGYSILKTMGSHIEHLEEGIDGVHEGHYDINEFIDFIIKGIETKYTDTN